MAPERSLLGNLLRNGVATGSNILLFVLAAVAGRYLGPGDFGIFSFALAYVFFFDFIADPGLHHLLIRQIAREPEKTARYMRHGLGWKLIASPIAFGLMAAGVHLLHDEPRIHQAVYLIAVAGLIKSTKDIYRTALLAHERFGLDAISALLERGALLVAGSLTLMAGHGLIPFCWIFVGVRGLDLLVIRQITVSAVGTEWGRFEWSFLRSLVRAGAPIGAFYVALNLYNYVDTVMISVLRNETETGWYGASFRVYEGLLMVPTVIGTVLLPRLSRAYSQGVEQFRNLASSGYKYVFLLSLFVGALGALLAGPIVQVAFGDAYGPSVLALVILVAGAPFVFVVQFLHMVLIAMDRQKLLFYAALLGLLTNAALNAAAIPLYGFLAAAVVTVAVEALVCVGLSVIVHRDGALFRLLPGMAKAVLCWLVAGAFVLRFLASLPEYIQASVFAIVFGALLWLVGEIRYTHWRELKETVS